ncbi:DUF2938 domain-containing protein [Ochrobactrum sp. Marseille-Q0166]|uniref:DUF2938 domain-containing protein n=1 Tax=Ochrobactrum sp. Marseille-Q0166 TaxID=2761105 RepID=UPI00165579D8|nr:DUF2938 domain-containing protein [Ochrobactrum sp. Marseille-Q0166]MBC8719226.1 DUF2938 domain-containing protein [Ochrobactrum sp. Marseille-Q0166]
MLELMIKGIAIGIGATVVMDVWAMVFARFPGQSRPNWGLVGRWFWHLRHGQICHDDISKSPAFSHEVALGWLGHYVVGVLYGIIFAMYGGSAWFANPLFLPAWIFGILTVAAGWFLLQPGLGIRWAASRLPNANNVRILNVVAHTFFALGMYATGILLKNIA